MIYLILGAGPAGLTVANKLKLGGKRFPGVGKKTTLSDTLKYQEKQGISQFSKSKAEGGF